MRALQQRERLKVEGGGRGACSPMLVLALPFAPPPNCNMLAHLCRTHRTGALHTRRGGGGGWEGKSRFGRAGELQSQKIDESSRRPWAGLPGAQTGSIYIPAACLPGQGWLSFLPSSFPCGCALCLECPCHLEYSFCLPRPSSKVTCNAHVNHSCPDVPVFTLILMFGFMCLIPARLGAPGKGFGFFTYIFLQSAWLRADAG